MNLNPILTAMRLWAPRHDQRQVQQSTLQCSLATSAKEQISAMRYILIDPGVFIKSEFD